MRTVGGGVSGSGRMAAGRLVVVVLALAVLAACGATSASPAPPESTSVAPGTDVTTSSVVARLAASSANGADQLAQVLMAPRPLPFPTLPPGVEPPPPEPPPPPYKTGTRAASVVITPPPPLPPGDGTVYAVGDSVLLGTKDLLPITLGGWDLRFDARVSRAFPEGIDLVHENRANIGQAAIVLLGHNYWGGGKVYSYLDQMMADMRSVQRVIVVTVAEWSPAQVEVNRAIRALPRTYPNVVVADWAAVLAADPQFLSGDNVHLTGSGNVALANLLAIMLGPARPNGKIVPPPKILPIPGEPTPTTPTTSTSSTTTTTSTSTTTSSTPPTSATTTSTSTTTTIATPSTATTSSTPTTTAPP